VFPRWAATDEGSCSLESEAHAVGEVEGGFKTERVVWGCLFGLDDATLVAECLERERKSVFDKGARFRRRQQGLISILFFLLIR
jgi:hypothetical protein